MSHPAQHWGSSHLLKKFSRPQQTWGYNIIVAPNPTLGIVSGRSTRFLNKQGLTMLLSRPTQPWGLHVCLGSSHLPNKYETTILSSCPSQLCGTLCLLLTGTIHIVVPLRPTTGDLMLESIHYNTIVCMLSYLHNRK